MVNDAPSPSASDLMTMYRDVTKVSLGYRNGTTLNLEGDALQHWLAFQTALIGVYVAMISTAQSASDKPSKRAPITRTLGDELNKTDRS